MALHQQALYVYFDYVKGLDEKFKRLRRTNVA